MAWTSLCELQELEPGHGKYVEIDGFELAVFLLDDQIFVIDNTCPHAGGSLSGGYIDDGCVICPWHYWAFRLANGELKDAPGVKISTYSTRIHEYEGRRLVQADLPMP